jgi:type VI secretion system protein ImpA
MPPGGLLTVTRKLIGCCLFSARFLSVPHPTMALIDVDSLLAPISDGAPCGPDLEYDSVFLALEEAAKGKPEQQFGDTIIPGEDPDWRQMQTLSRELLGRTRDIRVAVHLLRASTRLQGLRAAAEGLQLVHGLLAQHWDHVHPKLDADDDNDPTMRLNALAPLVDGDNFIADLRKGGTGGRNGVTGRDIELAFGKGQPPEGETFVPAPGVLQALQDAQANDDGLCQALAGMVDTAAAIDAIVSDKATVSGPEFRPLRLLLQALRDAAQQALGGGAVAGAEGAEGSEGGDAAAGGAGGGVVVPGGLGALRSRQDAINTLDKVCQWIELNEPSNPAPLLIRRAQRLINMSFLEIIKDLVPDGVDQVTKLAGIPNDQY